MISNALVDTGPLVAILDTDDSRHTLCVTTLSIIRPPLFTCWPVLTEAAYLLRSQPKLVQSLILSLNSGFLQLKHLEHSDCQGMASILSRYADQAFQLADVAIMHLAEREEIETVFTLDRRDFLVYRRKNGRILNIVPEVD